MAIRGFEKKDPYAGLNQLMQLMNQMDAMGARKENRIANRMTALSKQIENANSLDSLSNISNSINTFNKEVEMMGYDEYSLSSLIDSKKQMFEDSNNAFNNARKYLDMNEGDPDKLYNNIMGMSWGEANSELNNLYSTLDSINQGVKSGFNYKSEGKYTRSALGKAVEQRIGQIQNKLDVFAENEGEFLVYNPEDGSMDEFSLGIYKDLQFKILSGDTKDFDKYFDDVIDNTSRKFQIQEKGYNDWLKIFEQSKLGKSLADMDLGKDADMESYQSILFGNGQDDSNVDPTFAKQMAENYRTNAIKYNRQHEVLTGSKYHDNPTYTSIDLEDQSNIPGTSLNDNASKVDSNSKQGQNVDDLDIEVKGDKAITIKQDDKKTTSTDKITMNMGGSTNLKKDGNIWKVYDEESNSYKNLPEEHMEEISINGKFQKVPVMRGERTVRKKDGSYSKEENVITHIYVNGKWKKAAIPEKKKQKPKGISRRSGPGLKGVKDLPLMDFPSMTGGRIEQQKREEQESFWKAISEVLSKGSPFK